MRATEIRHRILAEHSELRRMLDEIEALAAGFGAGSPEAAPELRERGLQFFSRFRSHLELEERLLAPALRVAEGGRRFDWLQHEHRQQRQRLNYLLGRMSRQHQSALLIARELRNFVQYLRQDMAHEEETLLSDEILGTDVTIDSERESSTEPRQPAELGRSGAPVENGGSAPREARKRATDDEPGFCMRLTRVARRISSQHEKIESFYAPVAGALAKGDEREAQATLARLCDALAAHFSLEEGVWFPALTRHRPAMRGSIAALERDHGWFFEELDQIRKRLSASEIESVAARFDRLAAKLATHDGREEELIERILGSPTGTPRPPGQLADRPRRTLGGRM